jgi:ubiquinone biosynthesis protein
MLPSKLSPTRLLQPSERSPVAVVRPKRPSRLRTWYVLYHFFLMICAFLALRLTGRFSRREYGRRVRHFLERMGTLWIRAGQILALRSDVFSADFCDELSNLRDKGSGIPFELAQTIIEDELGAPLERHFDEFQQHPFDATTISQVHLAHLRDEDIWVAVNVQRPHARWMFQHDAKLIRRIVRLLRVFSIHPNMRWQDLCIELDALMTRELDYRYEASSLRQLKKRLRPHGVYVHKVISKYSARRIFVTEFVRGALMSDYVRLRQADPPRLAGWLETNHVDARKLARRLFHSVFRQVFEDNLFHADMHPKNIILLRNSRFSVLDARNVGSLESENLAKHRMFFEALADQNYTVAADLYLFLASSLPVVDVAAVRSQLVRAFRAWETRTHIRELPLREKSISRLFHDLNNITFRSGFQSQWSMSRLARTWANLDASLECLWPEMNYLTQMRKYFRRARRRDDRKITRNATTHIVQNLSDAARLPKGLAENELFRQTIIRRQARVFQGSTSKVASVVSALFSLLSFGLLLTVLFLCAAFVQQHCDVPMQGILGRQWSVALQKLSLENYWWGLGTLLLAAFLYVLTRRWTRYFRQRDVRVPEVRAAV